MEMAGKQLSPFMEMVVQLRLTACATMSYGLWKWCATQFYNCAIMSYRLYNCVLQLVQPCLTVYGNGVQPSFTTVQLCLTDCTTASYSLWKWLASSSPHLWKRF